MEEHNSSPNGNDEQAVIDSPQEINNPVDVTENIVDDNIISNLEDQPAENSAIQSEGDKSQFDESVNSASINYPDNILNKTEKAFVDSSKSKELDEIDRPSSSETDDVGKDSSPNEQSNLNIQDSKETSESIVDDMHSENKSNITGQSCTLESTEDNGESVEDSESSIKLPSPKVLENNLEAENETSDKSISTNEEKEQIDELIVNTEEPTKSSEKVEIEKDEKGIETQKSSNDQSEIQTEELLKDQNVIVDVQDSDIVNAATENAELESNERIEGQELENEQAVTETLDSESDSAAIVNLGSECDQAENSEETVDKRSDGTRNTGITEDSQELDAISESVLDRGTNVDESAGSHNEGALATIENDVDGEQNENTEFVHVSSEKDYNEKDKGDELLEDPIGGGDENDTENPDAMAEGADEELCIIPDTERVLSQEEKDSACTLTTLKDISATTDKGEMSQNTDLQEASITVIKYKDKDPQTCYSCVLVKTPKYEFRKNDSQHFLCNDDCLDKFKKTEKAKISLNWESEIRVKDLTPKGKNIKSRRICASCKEEIYNEEMNLCWEIMDFCNETCLTKYQKEIGSKCSSCSGDVKANSLGKYCVRFGNDIRQFCSSLCLETHKKGLKVCAYCQQDSPTGSEGFLAVGDKGQFKDFCSQVCMEKYDIMTNNKPPKVAEDTKCCVCKLSKPITMSFEHGGNDNYFCSEPCFVAFSFVNNIKSDKCAMCRRNFCSETLAQHTMFYENSEQSFCSNSCQNIYIIAHRKIVPCTWCKVRKYNFDMIRRFNRNGPFVNMCSVNCLNLYQVSLSAVNSKKTQCNFCLENNQAMYHLTMSDATIRNFCSYMCVMSFQNQFNKSPITLNEDAFPVPMGTPKRSKRLVKSNDVNSRKSEPALPVISSVQSLANSNGAVSQVTRSTRSKSTSAPPPPPEPAPVPVQTSIEIPVQVKHHIIVKNAPMPMQRNVATMCRTRMSNKGMNATPKVEDAQVQTDKREADKILIPVPIPIFIPLPMHMFAAPVPMPVPIPIPVPVPVFIPTTRNSANGIMKEIKKIQVKIPTNPYEAELLMMAEMVADDKKEENTDSESDVEDTGADDTGGGGFSPEPQDGSNTFGDDMLQMALKMATELDEPAVDLEGALTANTITASQSQDEVHSETAEEGPADQMHIMERAQRGRKRGMRGNARGQGGGVSKRGRRSLSQHVELPMMQQPPTQTEPQEKPDANMCLKYTFGVNAWKQWVTFKNAELEKSSRRVKLFKTEILQLTADELNYSLCLFVKEVRKPNGAEYAPDTIYYLCLGIQQYLFENGRIDNIFCDAYYEKFTDCLDEVAKRFSVLYNDSHYIVTRVEEEHLWESKQLGAHSPHVLLSTLMFFNTKHFNLTTVDEHMQLSFSHIMKHWKRNPNQAGASKIPGSRNVLLRFYPPQSAIQNNARKKKVYEQQENEENPLRCPVKLYEFYLSKCPESVKTRNDVFYLQPERSCVPDSPVWYSTMPLPRDALEKMLHRVKMVKEINVALLTS